MKMNYQRGAKLAVLAISSLLIASVSAAVYNQLFQTGTVTATTYGLKWINGADNGTVTLVINQGYCSMSSLTAPVGGGRNYTDPVRLNNTEASSHTFNLVIESLSGSTPDLEYIYVRLYNSTGSYKDRLTIWNGSQGSNLNNKIIAAHDWWRFEWDIKWNSGSTTSSSVSVTLRIDVTA